MKGRRPLHDTGDIIDMLSTTVDHIKTDAGARSIFERLNVTPTELDTYHSEFKRQLQGLSNRIAAGKLSVGFFWRRIQDAALARDAHRLEVEMKYALYGHVLKRKTPDSTLENQHNLVNLVYPSEWWPKARYRKRTIHLHVGPTNSGKTYHALKRLEEAKTGIYAGPLRLLAHEVWTRLNARGKPCMLLTGDDRRAPELHADNVTFPMISATVEMVPTGVAVDVAVIDEIQMIADVERGWAWTQAVLGVQARELHLCGEARTVDLIKEMVSSLGDEVHVHEYERLSPLKMDKTSLEGNLNRLRKGDCIVAFTIVQIHTLRKAIERRTGKRVAIIYGSLPPETRAQQAALFNDPDNDYDYLVASNAIGMGLNLSIRRIIFATTIRFDGLKYVRIPAAEVKQIGGRAGRFSTAREDNKKQEVAAPDADAQSTVLSEETVTSPVASLSGAAAAAADADPATLLPTDATSRDQDGVMQAPQGPVRPKMDPGRPPGLVTTMERSDFGYISDQMEAELEPLTTAGLFPPVVIVERFARYFPPNIPFSYLLLRLYEVGRFNFHRYHLCDLRPQLAIADAIEHVEGLTVAERMNFIAAPIQASKPAERKSAVEMATCVAETRAAHILQLNDLDLEALQPGHVMDRKHLGRLEALHKCLVVFLWLSYRFPNIFTHRSLAMHAKELTEQGIEETLKNLSFDFDRMRKFSERALKFFNEQEPSEQEPDERLAPTGAETNAGGKDDVEIGLDEASEEDGVVRIEQVKEDDTIEQRGEGVHPPPENMTPSAETEDDAARVVETTPGKENYSHHEPPEAGAGSLSSTTTPTTPPPAQ